MAELAAQHRDWRTVRFIGDEVGEHMTDVERQVAQTYLLDGVTWPPEARSSSSSASIPALLPFQCREQPAPGDPAHVDEPRPRESRVLRRAF